MTNTHLPENWAQKVLTLIGGHLNTENLRLMNAWQHAEGGTAKWNPLNTTFDLPGTTDYNSSGVKNYSRPVWGICATAMTITDPASGSLTYSGILGDLQNGTKTAIQIVQDRRTEFKHWGTDPDVMLKILNQV